MTRNYLRGIYWRLTGAMMLIVIGALIANSYLSHRHFSLATLSVSQI